MPGTPSAQWSLIVRVEIRHVPGMLGRVASAIGEAGGTIGAVDLVSVDSRHTVRDITVQTAEQGEWDAILGAIESIDGARVIDHTDRTLLLHLGGKIELHNKHALQTRDDLSMAYTPGVARVCRAIEEDPDAAFQYTIKRNTVAVVSDGTAVLGLGDIGPRAAMPVMEGKAMLFKEFGGVDAFPVCLDTKDPDEIVATVERIAPAFGGVNLEDISAPRCFEIERRLKDSLDVPVFHDDQHGTAIVTLAALFNALKIIDKRIEDLSVLVIGLGAAGVAVTKMLLDGGVHEVVGCDSRGALSTEREDYLDGSMPETKRWYAEHTNEARRSGKPADVIEGTDLVIGLSGARVLEASALGRMNRDPMVFAMANPTPEVSPEEAAPYVRIMATGRSDYPNQINNVLAFPGLFRGALDSRAVEITESMKMAAAHAIAELVPQDGLREEYIIPSVFNRDVAPAVAAAVEHEARESGAATARGEVGFAEGDSPRLRGSG
ncbi:MAG TPA: NAD-dependent malic enzyme [Solirubrobacteraceae bacterium]